MFKIYKVKKLERQKIIDYIKKQSENSKEITYRDVEIKNIKLTLVYTDSVSNSGDISKYVIKSIVDIVNADAIEKEINSEEKVKITKNNNKSNKNNLRLTKKFKDSIYASSVKELDISKDDIFYYIYSGFVLLVSDTEFLAIELKQNLSRSVTEPTTEATIKGPKDAFNENYKTNIGLIRRRIKDEKLIVKERKIGRRTKTQLGILYISDIAKTSHVKEIEEKLDSIDIDGIVDSNDVREMLVSGGSSTDFPTIINTERPDLVTQFLLEGRIALVIDNTPYVLVLPSFLTDHFKSVDDNYQKNTTVYFMRVIRILSFFVTLVTPAIYIAITTFNHEALPTNLLISFAVQRSGVPFPAFLEAIIMIIAFEFLREGDNRVPSTMGSTLSIVGALVIGDAAVSAGIVSPIMLIVIAMTKITGLLFPDINFSNAIRNWRIIFLICASIAGLFGFMIGLIVFVFKLSSINILHTPYTYPFAPIDSKEIVDDTINRKNIVSLKNRKSILTSNITRLKVNNKES